MRFSLLLLVAGIAPAAAGQAPVITPRGDPSVRSDTIYALAVKPADHPDEPFVYLLDDGVIRLEADGRSTRTYRQVVQVLQQDAVEDWAEQSFSYEPGHQRLTVNWIRVLNADGTLISDKPAIAQDADVPAAMGDPVYTDQKVRRISLSGVAPNTLVDYSYTIEELKPYRPGDFFATWSTTTGSFTRRSRYVLDVPAQMTPLLVERNLIAPRRTATAHGRTVFTWAANDVARVKSELFAADSNGVYMTVYASAPGTWQAIGAWYAALSRGREAATPALDARVHALVADARTLEDSLAAVHRFVAQDIRYVSISLGIGGYQPRTPDSVLVTGYGDCKDKATLFLAMVKRMGLTAYPVLLNAGGKVERSLPSISQFDHAIAAVERPGGYEYVDLTSELTPWGQLPAADQGEFALVVHADGATEEVTLPLAPPSANLSDTRLTGSLSSDGFATVHYTERGAGARQYALRVLFTTPLDSTKRARFTQAVAGAVFPGATGDSLRIFDGKDLRAVAQVSLEVVHGQAAKLAGTSAILTLPFGSNDRLRSIATDLKGRGPRRFPINVAAVVGPVTIQSELRLTLPDGWRAQLPGSVHATSVFGSYDAEYLQEGRDLVVRRRMAGTRGTQPPDQVGALITWLDQVAGDDTRYIVLDLPAGTR